MRGMSSGRRLTTRSVCAALLVGTGGFAVGGFDFEAMHRANPDGSGAEELLPSSVAEGRGALALSDEHVYWLGGTFDGGIGEFPFLRRAGLDGRNVQNILTIVAIGDITIDKDGGKIYFTLQSDCVPCGAIFRTDLNGSNSEALFDAAYPRAIAFDPAVGVVCWADQDPNNDFEDAIVCGTLGDADGETILLVTAEGMAIDSVAHKLYWTGEGMVRRANLDGSDVEILVSGLDSPRGITLDPPGDRMWWTDRGQGKIQSAALDGSNVQDIVVGHLDPTDLDFLDLTGEGDKVYWLSESSDDVPATSAWGQALLIVTVLSAMTLLRRREQATR